VTGVNVSVNTGRGVRVAVAVGVGVTVGVGVGNPPESARPSGVLNRPRRDRANRNRQVSTRRRLNLRLEKSREDFIIFSILFP
jgi:hypothetical protein